MNIGRYLGAAVAMWIVRSLLNFAFYGKFMASRMQAMMTAHPGLFKGGVTGYVVTDLIYALIFVCLFTKVSGALGGGVKAGVKLGIAIALLSPVMGSLYSFFTFTYSAVDTTAMEMVYQLISCAIQGAVAGAIYKSSAA
jgi:hypothetical protein